MTPDEKLELLIEAERAQAPSRAGIDRGLGRLQQALGAQVSPIDIGPVDPTLLAGSTALGNVVALPWVAKVTAIVGVVASAGALVGGQAGTQPPSSTPTRPLVAHASATPTFAAKRPGSGNAIVSEAGTLSGAAEGAHARAKLPAARVLPSSVPPARLMPAQGAAAPVAAAAMNPTASDEELQGVPGVREPSVKVFDDVPSHAAPAPAFDAELLLIKRAKAEFDDGRDERARVWLSEHARRFPAGVFAAEREGLLVLSTCRANPSAGRGAALAFLRRYPLSPLAERIRHGCGLE